MNNLRIISLFLLVFINTNSPMAELQTKIAAYISQTNFTIRAPVIIASICCGALLLGINKYLNQNYISIQQHNKLQEQHNELQKKVTQQENKITNMDSNLLLVLPKFQKLEDLEKACNALAEFFGKLNKKQQSSSSKSKQEKKEGNNSTERNSHMNNASSIKIPSLKRDTSPTENHVHSISENTQFFSVNTTDSSNYQYNNNNPYSFLSRTPIFNLFKLFK